MKFKKKLFIVVFLLLNIYGLLCGVIYFFQENLIFMPTALPQEHVYKLKNTFEEINLNASDGAQLNGLHFKKENPNGLVLYFHGNAGNLEGWGSIAEFFVDLNYDVIIMDYRGYGKSTGELSSEKLYSDAVHWYDFAKDNYNESSITVYGRSLGTAFATYAAANNQPKKLVLEAPFYSMEEIAKSRFSFLPITYLLNYKFPSNQYINEVPSPITIYHGTKDQVIDFKQGENLYKSIKSESKKLIIIDNGGHNNLISFKEYSESIALEL
jgi:alpha-beta hydrolase superfamily lysophospholipase